MEDIAEQFAIRDRFLKHRQMQMTPEQRMQEMQERLRKQLPMSPQGYRQFLARNFKQRAIDVSDSNAS